jgi:hypothetical protein
MYRTHDLPNPEKIQFSVSYHPDKSIRVKTFRPVTVASLEEIARYIKSYVWSPILYKNNQRLKVNFIHARILGIDVDDGMPIADAIELIKDQQMAAVVGTTRSHQISKDGKPPCDRYRIALLMSEACTDRELFEYNVRTWAKLFRGDAATCDAGRLFRPCSSIVLINSNGIENDWLKYPLNYKTESERIAINQSKIQFFKEKKSLPLWVINTQKFGVPPGGGGIPGRHKACYRVGAFMTELGYTVDEITDFLCAGKLIEIGVENVRRQVEWGANRARGRIAPDSQ